MFHTFYDDTEGCGFINRHDAANFQLFHIPIASLCFTFRYVKQEYIGHSEI